MIIHITRHAQPSQRQAAPNDDHEHPRADPGLSALGTKQARFLGNKLKQLGFCGIIMSSPYRRTLGTASVVAEITSTPIIPEPMMQEYVPQPGRPAFDGLTLEKIKTLYPRISRNADLAYPWFAEGPEDRETVQKRVRPLLRRLRSERKEDVLLVGHGASVNACTETLLTEEMRSHLQAPGYNWNCSLSSFRLGENGTVSLIRLLDVSHIPQELVTSNAARYSDVVND